MAGGGPLLRRSGGEFDQGEVANLSQGEGAARMSRACCRRRRAARPVAV